MDFKRGKLMHFIHFINVFGLLSGLSAFSCSKQTMSERDIRREQLRLNAQKKRQEWTPIAGDYRGILLDQTQGKQDVSLRIEIKDIPEGENGQVDPVLVPSVVGALNLTYGSESEIELFSFAATKSDFNAVESRLDLVVSNSQFKELNLSLLFEDDGLSGTWSSPSTSTSGSLRLARVDSLSLGGETPPIKGSYEGVFEWIDAQYYTRGSLTISTAQDGADSFHLSSSLRVNLPSPVGNESFLYEFDSVEFNPLSRQISMRSDKSDLYFIGKLENLGIQGQWHSKKTGLIGTATLSHGNLLDPASRIVNPAASGSWYGNVTKTNPATNLPENLLLNFNSVPNQDEPGGLGLVGSARLFFGPFGSPDFLDFRFQSISYLPYSRRIVAVTQGSPQLTFQIDLSHESASGRITDSTLGDIATFTASRQIPASSTTPDLSLGVDGDYNGFFAFSSSDAYQTGRINLASTVNGGVFKISALVTLFLGPLDSSESLTYRFDKTEYNAVSGTLNLSNQDSDIVVKAKLGNGSITGQWLSTTLGSIGAIHLTKTTTPAPPPFGFTRHNLLKGTYRGSLTNTSQATNLPPRIMFGLITSRDSSSPRGLNLTGNLRLYYGSFESHEFTELPFDILQFDPYRRTISGKTGGAWKLTVQGILTPENNIAGTLSDDSLGDIGTFEVTQYDK